MMKKKFHFIKWFFALSIMFFSLAIFFEANFFNFSKIELDAKANVEYDIVQVIKNPTQLGETKIYVKSIEVEDREYDGTTQVNIQNIVAEYENGEPCNLTIVAEANTLNANAEENKYVSFSNFVVLEDSEDYEIILDFDPVFVNIFPYKHTESVTLYWETKDVSSLVPTAILPNAYVYTGIDQRKGVSAYYYNILGNRVDLYVNIVDLSSNNKFKNEFINAGNYEAQAVLTEAESNYHLADNSGSDTKLSLAMKKATSELIKKDNVTYTYTGNQQSLSSYVYLNNSEQTLIFSNHLFTNLNEGKALNVEVYATESKNYKALQLTSYKVPESKFIKLTSSINVDNIPTEYVYNGQQQTIEHLAFIQDNLNNEQTLLYSNKETFFNSEKNREIVIFANETENFNAISKTIFININKAKINTNNWRWSSSVFTYDTLKHSVNIEGIDQSVLSVSYNNNIATNAGIYFASADINVFDEDNYEPVDFPGIVWKINKAQVLKPNIEDRESTYTGVNQQIDILENRYYFLQNNINKNAGDYVVYVCLRDTDNYEWSDGSSNLAVNWKIKKAQVETPVYSKALNYTGNSVFIQLPSNELYEVLGNEETEIGKYKAFLLIKDFNNYEWKDNPNNAYLILNWEIINGQYNASSPILAIVFAIIIIIGIAIYLTMHFTIKARRRRRKRKAMEEKSNQNMAINQIDISSTALDEKTNSNSKQSVEENKISKPLGASSKNEQEIKMQEKTESKPKTRKKRMLSMKKLDKRERRKKENKKLAKEKKGPAKRGRPPKSKAKTKTKK